MDVPRALLPSVLRLSEARLFYCRGAAVILEVVVVALVLRFVKVDALFDNCCASTTRSSDCQVVALS
jgi:hypothetical protein